MGRTGGLKETSLTAMGRTAGLKETSLAAMGRTDGLKETSLAAMGRTDGLKETSLTAMTSSSKGLVLAKYSNGCSGRSTFFGNALAISATVSVKAQKYGGLSTQPIGRVSGNATN
jgi:hypothetical protein